MGRSHGPSGQHHGVCASGRERRVHRCGGPPEPIDDDGQRKRVGVGECARRAPLEPHYAASEPERDWARLLRALCADPAGTGRSRPCRQCATADTARPASNLLPSGRLSICRVDRRIGFARRLVATTDRVFSFAAAEGRIADILRTRVAPVLFPAAIAFETVRGYIFRTVSQNYRGGPLSVGAARHVEGGDRLPWVPIGKPIPSGVYGQWRANLGDQQEDKGTGRMQRHRQGDCRLLRGGQSGCALRSGSNIVRTIKGHGDVVQDRPVVSVVGTEGWRTEYGSLKKSRAQSVCESGANS
jgi:hypothetical protein